MHENIARIKKVSSILKQLGKPYVFVGGATVSLYATHRELAAAVRPTDDVDVVIEIVTYADQAYVDERLRQLGFANDPSSGVICRYTIDDLIVDVMPTSSTVWGFGNTWYPEGFSNAVLHRLDAETVVSIFSVPYFLASKWEAHRSRGGNNLYFSKDFEDIVYVLENCHDFDVQLIQGPAAPRRYLAGEWSPLLPGIDFEQAISAHMETARQGADPKTLISRLQKGLTAS